MARPSYILIAIAVLALVPAAIGCGNTNERELQPYPPRGATDYDCDGGTGNGPNYVDGPVEVSGSDPYDLDRDGNGIGCEEEG